MDGPSNSKGATFDVKCIQNILDSKINNSRVTLCQHLLVPDAMVSKSAKTNIEIFKRIFIYPGGPDLITMDLFF